MNILYILPRSTSDILQSTAVCRRIKDRFPDSKLFFAVQKEYVDLINDCPWIDHIIEYNQSNQQALDNPEYMNNLPDFDIVYTPHVYLQYSPLANFTHSGTGKNIIFHFAWHSDISTELFKKSDFFVPVNEEYKVFLPDGKSKYILFVTGTGNPAVTKHYKYWDEIVDNVVDILPEEYSIVQGGMIEDKKLENSTVIDYRGRTNSIKDFNKLVKDAKLVISIDSYPLHCAYVQNVPCIALFGNTYPQCSGPNYISDVLNAIAIDSNVDHKKCYKNNCLFRDRNCINEINPADVFSKILDVLNIEKKEYEMSYPTISGYTTIYNGIKSNMPIIEAINSISPYCDEVVVLDGMSTDGTWELLQDTFRNDKKVKLFQKKYDMDIPGIDGQQKAFSRALCCGEFCIQFDADQIFEDGEIYKIKDLIRNFPENIDLMHIPTIDYFGIKETIREEKFYISNDYHMSRFAISRNKDNITHGINVDARIYGDDGKVYAKQDMSDGCEYIDILTGKMIPQFGPYTMEIDNLRNSNIKEYTASINKLYKEWPKFHHVSWFSIERKIRHFIDFWDDQWQSLYMISEKERKRRWFNGIDKEKITDRMIEEEAIKLFEQGGCHLKDGEKGTLIPLEIKPPKILNEWIRKVIDE